MNNVERILEAVEFAAEKHRDQRRKSGDIPYINHPVGVAHILSATAGVRDSATLAAAILHDTLEDTATTRDELVQKFGERIAAIVAEVSDDKSLPKVERKRGQIAHAPHLSEEAGLVKLADKLHNLRDIVRCPPDGWDVARVRGYFCWAHAVVSGIGAIHPVLWEELREFFASSVSIHGETFRAVPGSEVERAAVLTEYYLSLGGR